MYEVVDGNGHLSAAQLALRLGEWRGADTASGYSALADRIRLLVLDGRLPQGLRLPAERELAATLLVSRGTVAAAYQRLRDGGFLHSRRGSGHWTALPEGTAAATARPFAPLGTEDMIDLAHAAPSAPTDAVHAAARRAVEVLPVHLAGHGYDLFGLPALREAVAARFCARGLPTTADQVMITSGAQHAFMLALRTLTGPGDRVVVEHPTYPNALEAIGRGAARPVPAPLSDEGWDLDMIASTMREANPALAYLVPDFQNPTGHQMTAEQRRAVVELARRTGTPLVVDETVAELALDGSPPPPLGAFAVPANDTGVITLGSVSKTIWGGLRIGWLRAPRPLLRRIAAIRASVDLGPPVLDQLVAADLLTRVEDLLPPHLARLRESRDHLAHILSGELPAWRFRVPTGGLSLWVGLGAPASNALTDAAAARGLRLAAGPRFGTGGAFESFLRVPFAHPPAVLDDAVHRLRDAWVSLRHAVPAAERATTPAVV